MNFTDIFNGMVGKDFIVAFNDNFRKTDRTFLSILATLIYKVKSTDIKEFKVIDGVVSYTLEEAPEEGEEDTREWIPVDITKWGNINGSLEDQTDLKEALDSKAAVDTVAEIANILSTLNEAFNNLRNDYEDTEVNVARNTGDIATLKTNERTKVTSNNIKAIRVSDSEFQWSIDGITWYAMPKTTSLAWGQLVGNIDAQEDLMALINIIRSNVTDLSGRFTTLSNSFTALSGDFDTLETFVGTLSDNLDALSADVNTKVGALREDVDIVSQAEADHESDQTNPHNVTASQLGLGNVDNTADVNKPVSTPQREYIEERIAEAGIDDTYLVHKLGLMGSMFVGTELEYNTLTEAQKNDSLAVILRDDWNEELIASLLLSLTNSSIRITGGAFELENTYTGEKVTGNFNSGKSTTITNIMSGNYQINNLEATWDDTDITVPVEIKRNILSIRANDTELNIIERLNEMPITTIDSIVLAIGSDVTINNVYSADETVTLTKMEDLGPVSSSLTGERWSTANGVPLGDYFIEYEVDGTPGEIEYNVTTTEMFRAIDIEGGNE